MKTICALARSAPCVALAAALALAAAASSPASATPPAASPTGLYLVELDAHGAAFAAGSEVKGLGRRPADGKAPAALTAVDAGHARFEARAAARLGRAVEPLFRYRLAGNGLALRLDAVEAAALVRLPGVVAVRPDVLLPLATDVGPGWIGAPSAWDGPAGSRGEGTVVGVVDTGINSDHPSFTDSPPDGYVYPAAPRRGICDPGDPAYDPGFACNDKLIGAWDFVDVLGFEHDGAEDSDYHGSHVSGIAVGNGLDFPPVSGVAPRAHLIAYDACTRTGSPVQVCPLSAVRAAVEQAILDGVDVLNLSLGGGNNPWTAGDLDAALLDAVAAGIVVVTSAGNDGPTAGSVGHRGPWVLTVAAATHSRLADRGGLSGLAGGATPPPADLAGLSLTDGYGPAPIALAGDCSHSFPAGTWTHGEIVVCDHRNGFRLTLCQNVVDGGAGGCVLTQVPGGIPFVVADFHLVPGVHLDVAESNALRAWLATGSGHSGRIDPVQVLVDPARGDLLASFSSRGPVAAFDVLKPELTGPGVDVLSAIGSFLIPGGFRGAEFLTVSGTSMASPHVAGAAALLRSAHPDWTPAEVGSVLVSTASPTVRKTPTAPASLFEGGAGRVDAGAASRARLVFPESAAAYAAADPAAGGSPVTLNAASLVGPCAARCVFERRVRNGGTEAGMWTPVVTTEEGLQVEVTPARLHLIRGQTRTLRITVKVAASVAPGARRLGEIVLQPDERDVAPTRLPVAIRR